MKSHDDEMLSEYSYKIFIILGILESDIQIVWQVTVAAIMWLCMVCFGVVCGI